MVAVASVVVVLVVVAVVVVVAVGTCMTRADINKSLIMPSRVMFVIEINCTRN
jgi:hypothetical protein